MNEPVDFSIVICAYNPDLRVLRACLQSVYELDRHGLQTEVILVDNNSSRPVSQVDFVNEYLDQIPNMCLLLEARQGVKYARIAAIRQARGTHIVYIDYDNKPERGYLQELKKLHAAYPSVAAWGPGDVTVIFPDGVEPALENYARRAFQERHERVDLFGAEKEWQPYYPFGTGLCTRASLLHEYVKLEQDGKLTLAGRKGEQLSSGEDTQMVLLCISKGFSAGVSPRLRLQHLITGNRANYPYLLRLAYGTSLCYETCLLQVFPERMPQLERRKLKPLAFSRRALRKYMKVVFSKDKSDLLHLAHYVGLEAGVYMALRAPLPAVVKRIVKKLGLE